MHMLGTPFGIILFSILTGFEASAQIQKFDSRIDCYGETLDVRMIGTNRNGDVVSEEFLSLPYKDHWWGVKLGYDNYLQYADCLPEPITSNEIAYGGFRTKQDNPAGFPKGFRRLRIHSYGNLEAALQFLPKRVQSFEEKGTDLESGFRWIGQTQETERDHAAADGTYLFPGSHRAWDDSRVIRSCAGWVCRSRYPITENLMVRMEFWNIVPYRDWIEHDQEMQRVLKSLIEGQE